MNTQNPGLVLSPRLKAEGQSSHLRFQVPTPPICRRLKWLTSLITSVLLSSLLTLTLAQAANPAPGTVVGWGDNLFGQTTPPPGLDNVTAIASGYIHGLALKSDGTVVGWGFNRDGEATPPPGLTSVIAISAGDTHSLALKSDGTVVGWGWNILGVNTPPAGLNNVVAIAAGRTHSLALKSDGTVVGWGDNSSRQVTPPAGLNNVIAIAAGGYHSLALKSDGTVVGWGGWGGWGDMPYGQATPPAGLNNVIAISAGLYYSLALKSDGTVVGWGDNTYGQITPPAGLNNVIAISAGGYHAVALKSDGTVVGWGLNENGQAAPPAGLTSVTAISAGYIHSLALVGGPARQNQSITFNALPAKTYGEAPFTLNATASSGLPVSYSSNSPSNCSVSGPTLTILAAGACSVTASQSGNSSYKSATPVTQSFTVNKATPQISVTGGTFSFDGQPHPASASVSGVNGASVAGTLTITYTPGGPNPPVMAGSYAVNATFASSDPNYNDAGGTGTVVISATNQTVTLSGVPATAVFNTSFTPSASSSAGLPVTIGVSGVCSLSDGTVIMTSGTGSCVVTASQAGDANYGPASTSRTVTAQPASQTLTFDVPAASYFPYPSANNTFSVGATASSGLPVSFSASGVCRVNGTTVTLSGVGECIMTLSQTGDTNYSPATPLSRTFNTVPNPTAYAILSLGTARLTATQTQGPVAALGDSSFEGTNLATAVTGPNAVTVQGNVSFGDRGNRVNGNVVYSGSLLGRHVTFARGGFVPSPTALPSTLKDYALKVSAAWAALPASGAVNYKPWGQISLSGSNPTHNVFKVDGTRLSAASLLVIQTPANAAVILNITGASDKLQNIGIRLEGPDRPNIIYNFYQATSLTLGSVGVRGTVWAPLAATSFTSASLTGSLIAGSLSDSNSAYHSAPFDGALPVVQ